MVQLEVVLLVQPRIRVPNDLVPMEEAALTQGHIRRLARRMEHVIGIDKLSHVLVRCRGSSTAAEKRRVFAG